jgi:hypothetical protein
MMSEDGVVKFPASTQQTEQERLDRIKVEAQRLAEQPEIERLFWMPKRAESLGVELAVLKAAVKVITDAQEKSEAEEQRKDQQREKQRIAAERAGQQRQGQEEKAAQKAEREREKAKKEAAKEAERQAKEDERVEKEKRKAYGEVARLPVARHDQELQKLATKFASDLGEIREEFSDFLGVGSGEALAETTPWDAPVELAALLSELAAKVGRYVVLPQPFQMTASVLWVAHCWLYDHGVPVHSPMLAATSAEANSGKSTLVVVLGFACPRFKLNIEMTGPTLYRYVDKYKPTVGLDEGDDIVERRSDLKHIINAGWTKGAKIPRQEKIAGAWQTVWFDPFTPKMIALLGSNLPSATRSRCIEIRMLPKRSDEKIEPFSQTDDAEFAVLRSKFARWAADNATALRDAKPAFPPGLNNRSMENWRLLLAIAELAGGSWPGLACGAAERLTHTRHLPSYGVRLLAAFNEYFVSTGKKLVTSEEMVAYLSRDPTSVWIDYNHGGLITQRQIAILLDQYEIGSKRLHPTGRSDFARMGYEASQFADAIPRYVPTDLLIYSPTRKSSSKKSKTKKRMKRRAKRR